MAKKQARRTPAIPKEIWILVASAFLIALGYGLIAPILPQVARSFDVSIAAAGAVVSIFAFFRLAFAPASGRLVNLLGSRRIYITGLVAVAVTTGLIAVATAYWQILALRAIAGIGSTMFTVSAMGLIIRLAPPEIRGRCSSIYGTSFLLGNIIGPVVGAVLAVLGSRWPFVIYGAGVLAAAAVVFALMPKKVGELPEGETPRAPMFLREAFGNRAYQAGIVSGFYHGWTNLGVRVAILPLLAAAIFPHGAQLAGLALAAFALGTAVILQVSGRLADSKGRKPFIIVGLVINAVFTVATGYSHEPWMLLASALLAGVGAGLYNPAQQASLADVIGSDRSAGSVLSTFQMFQDAGGILGPVVIGFIAGVWGYGPAFLCCGAFGLIAAVWWALRGVETIPVAVEKQP